MPPIGSATDLTPEQRALTELVGRRWSEADKLHCQYAPKWDQFYGLSRNWRRLKTALADSKTPNDKDVVLNDLKREWGQELFIPYCFTVIETNLPRILSRDPRYRALPGELSEQVEEARKPLEALFERDSTAMGYQRKLQETVRSGLRYGLGVQKDYWECRTRSGRKLVPNASKPGQKIVEDRRIVVFEGPQVESVDIHDFRWDPSARDLESAGYVIHRTWRSMEYVKDQVEKGKRYREDGLDQGWFELDFERIKKLRTSTARSQAWQGRYEASGISGPTGEGAEEFEIWEYHDRDQVLTVLGGSGGVLVQADRNPFLHGEYPFGAYRPTLVEHEFVGIGEVEPIAHLQWELNTLRGQRRDAATMALNQGYFYQEGALEPENIVLGPGMMNPVFGNPAEILQPMNFRDIPQSGISEEEAIKADIELATGMSEAVIGSGGEDTATGTQLVQNAANLRIKLKAKNLHTDLLVPETARRRALYEQYVVSAQQTQTIRVEDPTTPTGFVFIDVTPEMFQANVEIVPVDGSTEADDPAQKKHDAAELAQTLAPFAEAVDVPSLVKYTLEQHDVPNASQWVKHGPSADEAAGQMAQRAADAFRKQLEEKGVPPDQIAQIMEGAHASLASGEQQEPGQGPAPESSPESPAPQAPEPIGAQQ